MTHVLLPAALVLLAKLVLVGALYVSWQSANQYRVEAAALRSGAEHLLVASDPPAGALESASIDARDTRLRMLVAQAQDRSADSGIWIAPVLVLAGMVMFTLVLAQAWIALRQSRRDTRRAEEAMHSLQALLSTAPFAFLAWNSTRGVILWSDAAERMFGMPRDQVLGRPMPVSLEHVRALAACTRADSDEGVLPSGVPFDLQDARGMSIQASVSLSHLPISGEGNETFAAIIEDATPRLLRETRRLDAVRAQRDALVREVHHRIKNHLQGVAGLLRQHLGGKPLLQPLLEVATAQILSIAAVHGLQGEVRRGAPDLRMLIARIASSVSGIMHAPIEMVGQCIELGDIAIVEEEAVPIAMVLNELMMNAVKHRMVEDGSGAVCVEARCQDGEARIAISNPGFLPSRFNLPLGVHVGTGLGLVKSLLPQRGATLEIDEDGRRVVARLVLLAPDVLQSTSTALVEDVA